MGDIARFLSHKVPFITGSTGFLAKGLVEKILRDAADVKRVYLLIRPGAQGGAEERLEREVFRTPAFTRLMRTLGPRFHELTRQKVVAVAGDLTQSRLGIDPDLYAKLTAEVDIVINSAATVVFDEEIDLALDLNTLGPRRILEFAQACRDAVFCHVSTAYVNGQRTGLVPEALMPPDRSVAQMIDPSADGHYDLEAEIASILVFARQVEADSWNTAVQSELRRTIERQSAGNGIPAQRTKHQVEGLRTSWVKRRLVDEGMRRARRLGWNDSYTLTKAMGEQLLARSRGNLPVVIVRPSIIESSLAEPEAGWLDGLKVADPLIVHYSKGRLPDFPADPSIVLDLIPVDLVANAILAAVSRAREARDLPVYQVASGTENPLKLGEMFELMHEYFLKNPVQNRRGETIRVQRWTFPSLERFRRQCRLKYGIPLNTIQWLMRCSSALPWSPKLKQKVSVLEATLGRIMTLTDIYTPYMYLDCRFETRNTRRLYESLDSEDREKFNFDVRRIDWREYVQDIHIPGLRRQQMLREMGGLPLPDPEDRQSGLTGQPQDLDERSLSVG